MLDQFHNLIDALRGGLNGWSEGGSFWRGVVVALLLVAVLAVAFWVFMGR